MKRFFECLIPNTSCNLECKYCYIIQDNRRKNEKAHFRYNAEHIGKALSIERLGGISLISMTASGETLISPEMPDIIHEVLKQGHFVNVTTNGTLSKRFDQILDCDKKHLTRLHFSFSFHYLELIRTNKLTVFFDNIKKIRSAGCSFVFQINLYDEYVPHWEDIKQISLKEVGALPQVALTRDGSRKKCSILTNMSTEKYIHVGKEMNSPLFDFTCKNFMVKRKEFCYAGEWSATLNLATGRMTGCYGSGIQQNIFEDISKPIKFACIGNNCDFDFCFNSSHFLSLGTIPQIKTPSYGDLRNRDNANWYFDDMKYFLSQKLSQENTIYNKRNQYYINFSFKIRKAKYILVDKLKNLKIENKSFS